MLALIIDRVLPSRLVLDLSDISESKPIYLQNTNVKKSGDELPSAMLACTPSTGTIFSVLRLLYARGGLDRSGVSARDVSF